MKFNWKAFYIIFGIGVGVVIASAAVVLTALWAATHWGTTFGLAVGATLIITICAVFVGVLDRE